MHTSCTLQNMLRRNLELNPQKTALIVRREGIDTSEAEIKTFCGEAVVHYKVPKKVVFVESLPLNASSKILKCQLQETYGQ